jgi:hypothetical protein
VLFGLHSAAVGSPITFGTAGIYVAFLLIALAALIARLRGTWKPAGRVQLGGMGVVINALAVAWLAFETVNIAWPRESPARPVQHEPEHREHATILSVRLASLLGSNSSGIVTSAGCSIGSARNVRPSAVLTSSRASEPRIPRLAELTNLLGTYNKPDVPGYRAEPEPAPTGVRPSAALEPAAIAFATDGTWVLAFSFRLHPACRWAGLDRLPLPASSLPSWPASRACARGACAPG